MKPKSSLRRAVLSLLALAAFAGPPAASGCSAGFTPISQVDALRVLAVVADKPYANPGEQVTFTMTYDDPAAASGGAGSQPVQIVWLAGCIDPAGDEYYGCYSQFAGSGSSGLDLANLPKGISIGYGDTFTLTVPPGIITDPPTPSATARTYGLAIVFFAVCAGTIGPVQPDGTGLAGSLPFGCFNAAGQALGADSFVPGYTQVYSFSNGRTNANPPADGLTLNGVLIPGRGAHGPPVEPPTVVERCGVSEDERASAGCGKTDPSKACPDYELSVFLRHKDVPNAVSEVDESITNQGGGNPNEEVWVDYFADRGDIDTPVTLVWDATAGANGLQASYNTRWYPPPTPGPAKLWAVVHDSRGGESVVERTVNVQ